MPRYLVAYYSWTGNTAKIANLISEALSADMEEIRDREPRTGPFAFAGAAVSSVFQESTPIAALTKDPADYDLVILGSPVWGRNMATPVRTYIHQARTKIKKLGLFCTLGGAGGKAALGRMAALCGRRSVADLIVNGPALTSESWRGMTEDYVRQVQKVQSLSPG